MTQEEKQLLLIDLCARLPYGVKVLNVLDDNVYDLKEYLHCLPAALATNFKPYLRPMSIMTEEERKEFNEVGGVVSYNPQNDTWVISSFFTPEAYDWLNENAFDYRGLIPMGLALEAPEDMYKTESL